MPKAKRTHVTGFREARLALETLSKATQKNVGKRALMAPARVLAGAVAAKTPVKTGTLKSSVKAVPSKMEKGRPRAAVLADDVAAVPIEFGTSKMTARPFFRPAVEAARDMAGRAFAAALKPEIDAAVERAAKRGAKK
ncbi:HK97-gp10 family putative phage morphogenesis protein [Allosphingosinicella indica]|uniref:Phage protein, HK97 gp10 family n=1 Tax=Allosphingosinicella indica TaxID=941907 RepID=A0A1X7GJA8_9SPHN|nr:HK97-gp10 family putative phage morphogenesis protein [Allosphingosinicella indica]SMF70530.1 phage protein, HK97 gp10 family [Allosphingosinicella indica]